MCVSMRVIRSPEAYTALNYDVWSNPDSNVCQANVVPTSIQLTSLSEDRILYWLCDVALVVKAITSASKTRIQLGTEWMIIKPFKYGIIPTSPSSHTSFLWVPFDTNFSDIGNAKWFFKNASYFVLIIRVCACNICEIHRVKFIKTYRFKSFTHYSHVKMSVIASQITNLTIVYSTMYSGADQRKHQNSASMAFLRGIHRWPANSPHKGPVTHNLYPFDEVIMKITSRC